MVVDFFGNWRMSISWLSKCYLREDSHDAQDSHDWFVTSWEGQENQECCCHDQARAGAQVIWNAIARTRYMSQQPSKRGAFTQLLNKYLCSGCCFTAWTQSMVVCKMLYANKRCCFSIRWKNKKGGNVIAKDNNIKKLQHVLGWQAIKNQVAMAKRQSVSLHKPVELTKVL